MKVLKLFLYYLNYYLTIRKIVRTRQKARKPITHEDRDTVFLDTLHYLQSKNMPLESDASNDSKSSYFPLELLESEFKNLSYYEQHYYKIEHHQVYEKIFLAGVILNQARKALDLQSEINRDNKKIAYYESKKNGSLDNLIDLWTKNLDGKNEQHIAHQGARREIKIKRLLATMKKKRPQHINFFLMRYVELRNHEQFSLDLTPDQLAIFNSILDFFEVGHATPDMIYKSLAIQLFELFKDIVPVRELKQKVALILDYSFGKEYKNFADFGKKESYIKNIVGEFTVFDFDSDQTAKQKRRIGKIFIANMTQYNVILGLDSVKPFLTHLANNPLKYRLLHLQNKYFGFFPKISS